jgi:hypothetical protein
VTPFREEPTEYLKGLLGTIDQEWWRVVPCEVRWVVCGSEARLQQRWHGRLGDLWLDVPSVTVEVMPPRTNG